MLAPLKFDSASVPLLERMVEAGRLPAMAELRSRAERLSLDTSPLELFPSGTYPTL